MAIDNILGLALQISADPSKAVEGVDEVSAAMERLKAKGIAVGDAFVEEQAREKAAWEAQLQAARDASEAQVTASAKAAQAAEKAAEPLIVYPERAAQAAAAAEDFGDTAERSFSRAAVASQKVAASQIESADSIESLRSQYMALAADAERLEALPFLSPEAAAGLQTDRELMGQITAEAQQLGAVMGKNGSMGGGIYESLQGIRQFRMIFAATIGLASFGFWVNEWGRLVGYLGDALTKMDGIHTAENDIVMSAAADALKQITHGETQQLLQPHDERTARLFQSGIEARLKTLETLRKEVQGLKDGTLAGKAYAEALRDITAKSREFGLQGALSGQALFGSQMGVLDKIEKQIKQYRALAAVEQIYMANHAKSAKAALNHTDALHNLIAAERDEITQLQIGDNPRRQAIAQYDAEIRRINEAAEALKRKGALTAGEAKEAEDARVLAAQIRDQKLKQIDDAEAAREAESYRRQEAAARKFADRWGKILEEERAKLQRTAAKTAGQSVLTGIRGTPSTEGILSPQADQATNEAAGHIDAETRAVWNLQAALLQTKPVMDEFAASHQIITGVTDKFSKGMGSAVAQAIVYGNSVGAAFEKAAKAEVASLAERAMVWALYETAVGIADLFVNPPAAAAAFESAAVFGAVGGAAAAIAHALPGGGGSHGRNISAGPSRGGYRSGYGGGSGQGSGPGVGSPMAPGAAGPQFPGGHAIVEIHGDEETASWIATRLNNFVNNQGGYLQSSHTKSSAPVGQ